jgi:mannose-6-phosphate isomerase-like protein (cupin superfamily)
MMNDFVISAPNHAFAFSVGETQLGTEMRMVLDTTISVGEQQTLWGVVASGSVELKTDCGTFQLHDNMTFRIPGPAHLDIKGQLFIVLQAVDSALFQISGPVEASGRLRYIDGCTDTLLISPTLKGEACLNHLHFPCEINQTMHTHPSYRLGYVLRGSGICHLEKQSHELNAGSCFFIDAQLKHAFETTSSSMDIVAFHPDSDFGPMHDDHPMINRTIIDGISASKLKQVQT